MRFGSRIQFTVESVDRRRVDSGNTPFGGEGRNANLDFARDFLRTRTDGACSSLVLARGIPPAGISTDKGVCVSQLLFTQEGNYWWNVLSVAFFFLFFKRPLSFFSSLFLSGIFLSEKKRKGSKCILEMHHVQIDDLVQWLQSVIHIQGSESIPFEQHVIDR